MDLEVALTEGPCHATQLARQAAADGFYAVIVCGGDGTVNEAATGLTETNTALGIVPAGSGNGLARHLGIPVDVDRSLRVIAGRHIISADYGLANGRPFFCTFGTGFDAAVSERFARQKRRGLIMYLKSAIDEYVKFSPDEYIIEANDLTITDKALLVVVCNASQYGNNAFIAPDASVTDGELDVTVVHSGNLFTDAICGLDILTGFIGKNAYVDTFRAQRVTIKRKRSGSAHIDGDPVVMPTRIDISCRPGALKLFAPTDSTRFKPIVTPAALFFRDLGIALEHLWPFYRH